MIGKDKFQELLEYCQTVRFGKIFIEIIVHQGEVVDINEIGAPLRNFHVKKDTEETHPGK